MVRCKYLFDLLTRHGIRFFSGVPDSLLKDICAYISDNVSSRQHVIAANEGASIALAAGHYLATGSPGLVYMQNSGQGNTVNPLMSLADPDVYSIPMLLLIGWRGEPGIKDEPQHVKQGKVTLPLLDTLDIPHCVLPENEADLEECLANMVRLSVEQSRPVALIVKKGTFEPYKLQTDQKNHYPLTREKAIELVASGLGDSTIVSTTGKISRELYEFRIRTGATKVQDFLTVGSMGHASQIALGIALAKPNRQVYCLDGDGAAIMHMGSLAVIGSLNVPNFKHIILNNGVHDSVGGQPTVGFGISFTQVAAACGYQTVMTAESAEDVIDKVLQLVTEKGPALLEVKVAKGARADLGRPKTSPKENKTAFMEFLSS